MNRTLGLLLVSIIGALAIAPGQENKSDKPAIVYFYRYHLAYAAMKQPSVYCDEKEVGRMTNGRFFAVEMEPGKHLFRSTEKQNGIEINLKSGNTYFVRVSMGTYGIVHPSRGMVSVIQPEEA